VGDCHWQERQRSTPAESPHEHRKPLRGRVMEPLGLPIRGNDQILLEQ
jgi:hypothetical protein